MDRREFKVQEDLGVRGPGHHRGGEDRQDHESGLDFEDGWIPTLDASLKVGEDNVVKYRYFEKSTTTNKTVT